MLLLTSSIRPSSSGQLGLSRVKSRLFIDDCLNPETDSGAIYTCVAITPFEQKRSNTKLIIVPRRISSSNSRHNNNNGNEKELELFGNSLMENTLIPGVNYHKINNNQLQAANGNDRTNAVSCLEKKSLSKSFG
ncbi:hypothetical protein BLA29_012838 [Euroglyphus maynei]|uniref:Uncharacterized protein n=1 Tax=Euroglyphus maynei TaxID=6958 RepID=A0A1Y3AKY0_EURMA|nr:hypothetical protein BLA29_012838 [Euroglyphus maynei]